MRLIKKCIHYFTPIERALWCSSVVMILFSFFLFDKRDYYTLVASLIGVTSLILCAKGNPIGQILMIIFSIFYGIISFSFRYYGEMITYLGMTLPMSIFALVSWLKNPYNGNKSEVKIDHLRKKDVFLIFLLAFIISGIFYFILKFFNTANLLFSTISVSTSFLAAALTFKRSPYYALAYAANDIILIVLWVLATITTPAYLSVVICFIVFLINDLYGFFNWRCMQKRQTNNQNTTV